MDYIEKARTITGGALCHYGHIVYSEMWHEKKAPVYCPICNAKPGDCPKKRIVLNISPHCWRF